METEELYIAVLDKKVKTQQELYGLIEANPQFFKDEIEKSESGKLLYGEFADKIKEAFENKKEKFSDAIIYNEEGKILLLLRTPRTDIEPDKWGLPGGHVDKGENPEEAVIREVIEETNLTISSCSLRYIRPIDNGIIHYYMCRVEPEQLLILDGNEHNGLKWVDQNELMELECIFDLKDTLLKIAFGKCIDPAPEILEKSIWGDLIKDNIIEEIEILKKAVDNSSIKDEDYAMSYHLALYTYMNPYTTSNKELKKLDEVIEKGREKPIGYISPDGKYKKVRLGKDGWEYNQDGWHTKNNIQPEKETIQQTISTDINIDAEPKPEITEAPKQVPSKYQQAIFDFVESGKGNAAIDAKAGSGKTTTIVNALEKIPPGKKVAFCAFSKAIVEELQERVPKSVSLATLHSFGFKAIKAYYGKIQLESNKNYIVLNDYIDSLAKQKDWGTETAANIPLYMSNIYRLISIAKQNINYDPVFLLAEADKLGVEILDDEPKHIKECLSRLYKIKDTIDYDDMIYLPAVDPKIAVEKYDYVFVDECQDLNKAQLRLLQKMYNPQLGHRFVAVGDPQQAIFGFAGSDENSFNNIATLPDTVKLPLSVSYRCAKNIINYVRQKTGVPIEPFEKAKDGEVNENGSIANIKDGDMVICRNTAPLLALCMKFIGDKKAAHVRGRDVGETLANQITKLVPKAFMNMESGFAKLYEKIDFEIEKAKNKLRVRGLKEDQIDNAASVTNIRERKECFIALRDESKTPADMITNIRRIFSDTQKGGIQLTTAHRSKGLEADRVFIIEDELLHGGRTKNAFQKIQENNLRYVAYTRAKSSLNLVTDWYFYGDPKKKKDDIKKSQEVVDDIDKALEIIKEAFDLEMISEKDYHEALEKAKHKKKILHHSTKTGKSWLQTHEVGSDDIAYESKRDKQIIVNDDDTVTKKGVDAIAEAKIFNKNPDYSARIIKINNDIHSPYAIMEKLNTVNAQHDFQEFIDKDRGYIHNWGFNTFSNDKSYNKLKDLLTTEKGKNLLDRVREIVLALKMNDIHSRNFGYDKNGNLKAIDGANFSQIKNSEIFKEEIIEQPIHEEKDEHPHLDTINVGEGEFYQHHFENKLYSIFTKSTVFNNKTADDAFIEIEKHIQNKLGHYYDASKFEKFKQVLINQTKKDFPNESRNIFKPKTRLSNYLDQLVGMNFNEQQKKYFEWQLHNSKTIIVTPTELIRAKYPQINNYLITEAPVIKQCYSNASKLSMYIPEVKYVEGLVSLFGIPIEHAWNEINGEYFDITFDLARKNDPEPTKYRDSPYEEYLSIIELDSEKVMDYADQTGYYGPYTLSKYKDDTSLEKAEVNSKIGESKKWHGKKFKKTPVGWTYDNDDKNKSSLYEEKQATKQKIQDFSDEELDTHAERASLEDLQKIVKQTRHPKLRETALKHLANRKAKESENSLYDLMVLEEHEDDHDYMDKRNTIHFDEEPDEALIQRLNFHGINYLVNSKEINNKSNK